MSFSRIREDLDIAVLFCAFYIPLRDGDFGVWIPYVPNFTQSLRDMFDGDKGSLASVILAKDYS